MPTIRTPWTDTRPVQASPTASRPEAGSPRPVYAVNAQAAVMSGVIAGLVFLVLELLMVPLFLGGSMWEPVRMIAAVVMGQGILPPPATFDLTITVVALAVHFALSIAYAFALAWLLMWAGARNALVIGAVFGLGLYVINFYGFTALFPWFASARNWVSVFSHAVFGAAAAYVYSPRVRRTARPY